MEEEKEEVISDFVLQKRRGDNWCNRWQTSRTDYSTSRQIANSKQYCTKHTQLSRKKHTLGSSTGASLDLVWKKRKKKKWMYRSMTLKKILTGKQPFSYCISWNEDRPSNISLGMIILLQRLTSLFGWLRTWLPKMFFLLLRGGSQS